MHRDLMMFKTNDLVQCKDRTCLACATCTRMLKEILKLLESIPETDIRRFVGYTQMCNYLNNTDCNTSSSQTPVVTSST